MGSQLDWNELKLVLAIVRAGSLAGAARRLGLSHATIFRHLNALEQTLGVSLFQRDRRRYVATSAGDALAATAAAVETQVLDVEQRLAGQDNTVSGTIRVTTTDTLMAGLLAPIFAAFQAQYPDIVLEISVSNAIFSLAQRDADIAIRPGHDPDENLVGRRIGIVEQAIYASRDRVTNASDSSEQQWIATGAGMIYPALDTWIREQGLEPRCRLFTNTMLAAHAAVAAGAGIAILPCYLGEPDKRLRRLHEPIPSLAADLWLLIHPDLRRITQFKLFNDFVFEAVREQIISTHRDEA